MPPVGRMTEMHTCPMVTGLVSHVGGPMFTSRIGDMTAQCG